MQEVRVEEQVELALKRDTFIPYYGKYTVHCPDCLKLRPETCFVKASSYRCQTLSRLDGRVTIA